MRRAPLFLALALVLGAMLWLVARPRERAAASRAEAGAAGAEQRGSEPVAIDPARRESQRRALEGAAVPADHTAQDRAPSAPDEPVLRVNGLVVEGSGGEHVPDAQVFLARGPARALTETGSDGRFRLVLPAKDWCFGESCELVVERGGERIFLGSVALQPELLVRARTHLTLRGRLITNVDLASTPFFVSASLPATETDEDTQHVGDAQLGSEGRFAIESWVELVPERFALTFVGLGGRLFTRAVPAAELLAEAGATVEQRFGELECLVFDEAHAPVPDAQVRIFVSGAGNDAAAWNSGSSDVDGRARFLVVAGSIDLCAGKKGFAPVVATLEHDGVSSLPHEILLRRLQAADFVRGRVIDALGRPLSGAHVSAMPATLHREIGAAGASFAQTGEDGIFQLVAGGDLELEVSAYHPDFGDSEPVLVRSGASELTLVVAEAPGAGPFPAISR